MKRKRRSRLRRRYNLRTRRKSHKKQKGGFMAALMGASMLAPVVTSLINKI